jgi:archaellum component FlaC
MAIEPESLVPEHLRHIRSGLDALRDDVREIKRRMTAVEVQLANVHSDFAGQSGRIDRIEDRLERIERRLDIAPVV